MRQSELHESEDDVNHHMKKTNATGTSCIQLAGVNKLMPTRSATRNVAAISETLFLTLLELSKKYQSPQRK
jgi:hypothetical protein